MPIRQLQTSLFEDALAPAAKPARPVSVARPPARIDGKAQYEGRQRDLDRLTEHWEDLHLWILRRNLRLLANPHTEDAERADIEAWLDAPLVVDRPVGAFSFQACVTLWDGRIDVAEFRQLVRRRLNRPAPRQPARAA